MLVRVSGFEISLNSQRYTIDTFASELTARSGQEIDNRTYYFDTTSYPGFCVGVIITVKDQSKYCKLEKQEDGKTKIVVNNLKDSEKIMDFNFFAIQLSNGVGVYQHYHQSAALSALERKMKLVAKELERDLVAIEEEKYGLGFENLRPKRKVRDLKKECKVSVSLSQIVTQAGLEKILEAYKKIKALDYVLTVLEPKVRHATPISDKVRKKREVLYFSNPELVGELAQDISSAIRQYKIKNGRVIVEDEQGLTKPIRISDMPEYLWEQEYDEVVETIDNIDPGDFGGNLYLQKLVKLFEWKQHEHILQVEFE